MTNIFKTPEKHGRKKRLFQIGVETLQKQGWTVSREPGLGKSSVRRISKNGESKLISIRTSQDQWIAFPPKPKGRGWFTLDDVEVVLAVSVDANDPPREALVHWLPADEMRGRFDRALQARKAADRVVPDRRGLWIPLYETEDDNSANVSYVGGGAGLVHAPIARVALELAAAAQPPASTPNPAISNGNGGSPIAEAKRWLAQAIGVPETSIRISIEA